MNIALYAHGGSGNHGCEALVRSTIKAIGTEGHHFTVVSERPAEDKKYHLDALADIKPSMTPLPTGLRRLVYNVRMKCHHDDRLYYKEVYRHFAQSLGHCDIALAIGGDNYCYRGFTERFSVLNDMLARRDIPTILWGCSIDPERINPVMLRDLRKYQLITARESITYQALLSHGLEAVRLIPDTAFGLDAKTQSLSVEEGKGIVGINVSPLVMRQEVKKGITLDNYRFLIRYILSETPYSIMLIPHVVWKGNDDRVPLRRLFEEFEGSGRMTMLDDSDAETLKGHIRRCRFLLAARTHASIAGYSTGVPTLVVGYSVKARGIATDLFGDATNYVVPISSMREPDQLTQAFRWMMSHEFEIRQRYQDQLDSYTAPLHQVAGILQELKVKPTNR